MKCSIDDGDDNDLVLSEDEDSTGNVAMILCRHLLVIDSIQYPYTLRCKSTGTKLFNVDGGDNDLV